MNKSGISALIASIVLLVFAIGTFAFVHDATKNSGGNVAPSTTGSSTNTPSSGSNSTTTGNSGSSTTTPTQSTTSCVSASQAASEEGQSGCVKFTGYAYTSGSGQMYLDQSTSPPYGFSVWIPAGTSGGSSIINEYSGKNIDVTGSIVNYNGEPEIEVTSSSQITAAQ